MQMGYVEEKEQKHQRNTDTKKKKKKPWRRTSGVIRKVLKILYRELLGKTMVEKDISHCIICSMFKEGRICTRNQFGDSDLFTKMCLNPLPVSSPERKEPHFVHVKIKITDESKNINSYQTVDLCLVGYKHS